jgi:hypothetical protein
MRWRLLVLLGIASLLCLLTPMQKAPNVHAQSAVLWSADHEEVGESDWYRPHDSDYGGGEYNSGCAGTSPVYGFGRNPSGTDPWSYSLVLTMAAPCGDLAVSGTRMFRWLEPQQHSDLHYKVWYYFPNAFTLTDSVNPWWTIMAWKSASTSPSRNDPFFNIGVGNRPNGNMFIYLYETKPYDPSSARSYEQTLLDLPVAQWFYIEGYYASRGDATGRVTIWQGDGVDRVLLWDLQGVQTRYPDAEGGSTLWSVDNYGNGTSPFPAQIAIDDAEIRRP